MSSQIRSLDDIFNDPLATQLLVAQPKKQTAAVDPDVANFKEIQVWVKQHGGKEPEKTRDLNRMAERQMASRLKGYRTHPEMWELLRPYDELGLLGTPAQDQEKMVAEEKREFNSIDDILQGDDLLLGSSSQTVNQKLFDTAHLHEIKREQENRPENKAQRKKMAGFEQYQGLFKQVQADLAAGRRQTIPYKSNQIELHHFYVLNGQLMYIEAIGAEFENDNRSRNDKDARVHVIYENGTENHPLRNGLIASLYGSKKRNGYGRIVTEPDETFEFTATDQTTGYIYVLKSASEHPEIKRIRTDYSLYKVGFTTGDVQNRIKNAENESTYLYGPVKVVETIQVVNLKAEALETALHHALANYRLDVAIKGPNGKMIQPREWFLTDLDTIDDAVNRIIAKLKINQ